MSEEYATQITRDWNVPAYGVGYVLKFEVDTQYLSKYEVQNVGGPIDNELWVPAELMEEFSNQIQGKIEVIAEFK